METTFYRFYSEIRAFLSKLMKDPINAKISKYLKDRNFSRSGLIKELMNASILERNERILTPDKTGEKDVKYNVKYKVRKKDFERRIKKIYIKHFEKNEPAKLNECEGGGDGGAMGGGDSGAMGGGQTPGGTSSFSVGADTTRGDVGYDVVLGRLARPGYNEHRKKKKSDNDILGKTIHAEGKKQRRIFITEEQLNTILEDGSPSTFTVGALGDYTAGGLVLKTSDGKEDPCAKAGKIKVKMVMDK